MRELPIKLDRLGSRVALNVMRDIWGWAANNDWRIKQEAWRVYRTW